MCKQLPLIEELATALNSLLAGSISPEDAQLVLARYDLERDRTDLDAATLPTELVVVIDDGSVTAVLTNSHQALEVTIVDYDVDLDDPSTLAAIPQTNGKTMFAHAFTVTPTRDEVWVQKTRQAIFVADCPTASVH